MTRRRFPSKTCPFCEIQSEAEEAYLTWFLMENYGSPATLKLLETRPFCARHRSALAERGDKGLSTTFEYLTEFELARLAAFREALARRRRPLRRHPLRPNPFPTGDTAPCLACDAGKVAVTAARTDLLESLGDEAGQEAYASGGGLCREHLWSLLDEAPKETALFLAEDAKRRLEAIREALRLYFHRLDYRHADEPKGDEGTAWRGALRFFWGGREP